MGEREKTWKRMAGETGESGRKTALAIAKRAARSELRQIFDQELKEREAERQGSLARRATASHSHS
jgi:hypothetical protein